MADRPLARNRSVFGILWWVGLLVAGSCAGGAGGRPSPVATPPLAVPRSPAKGDRFEGDFQSKLATSDPHRRFVALIDLTDQLDLKVFCKRLDRSKPSKLSRRAAVVDALERVAATQQAKLDPFVKKLVAEGSLGFVQRVAIVNRIVVEGTPAALLALGTSPEVALIRPDWTSDRTASRSSEPDLSPMAPPGDAFLSWAPESMKADRLWSRGFDGRGIVVATIDTGAFEAHEQLTGRRVPGERGWFDPVNGTSVGTDLHGHGTGVLSQAVGGNPDQRIVGIAPAARWAAALGNWHNFYSRSRMTLAADWILRTARPDVLVNAWSHDEGVCNEFDRPFIDAWKASGIFVVFPAGNGGPGAATGECPAQLSGIFPNGGPAFSVAALSRTGDPDALSSRGPSRCGSELFPSVAAPGSNLPMAVLGGPRAYSWGRGTSLSTGLVGGAVALLLQAAPEATPEAVERALLDSARDLPPTGRDDATGAGLIDLEAAIAILAPDLER